MGIQKGLAVIPQTPCFVDVHECANIHNDGGSNANNEGKDEKRKGFGGGGEGRPVQGLRTALWFSWPSRRGTRSGKAAVPLAGRMMTPRQGFRQMGTVAFRSEEADMHK